MIYNQVAFCPSGEMAYAEYSNNILNRYCDYQGNTITPLYDYVLPSGGIFSPSSNLSLPVAGQKQWMNNQLTYQQVSFISNTIQGYQINDEQGNISYTDVNGNAISLGVNGLTEMHIISGNVAVPLWSN